MLILLYLASPLLLWGARRDWRWLLIGAAVVQAGTEALDYFAILGISSPLVSRLLDLTPSWFLTTGIFWFCLGLVACLHLDRLARWLDRRRVVLGIAWVALLAIGLLEWEWLLALSGQPWIAYSHTVVDSLYAAAFILLFLSLDVARLRSAKRIGNLGAHSYGIYLVHGLVLLFVAKAIYHLAPWILAHPVLFFSILVAAGLALPLGMMAVARRALPGRAYHYLFG
jgi:peptidoglycan/LPS O-acetylase OafA/YrhL